MLPNLRACMPVFLALASVGALPAQPPPPPKLTAIVPTGSIPGVVRVVKVSGDNLKQLRGLRLKLQNDSVTLSPISVGSDEPLFEAVIRSQQRVGLYAVEMTLDGSTWTETGLNYSLIPANRAYVDCPLRLSDDGEPSDESRRDGISCSQALLDRKEASDIFGKRVAHMYLAVQVNLRNLSRDYDFVLHDVRLTIDDNLSVASRTRSLVRGVAEKGQVLDGRNLLVAAVTAAGTLAGGLSASSLFTKDFARATNIFQGPFRTALLNAFPDFTVSQMNRLNDHSLPSEGMVIPRDGPATLMAFASQRIFLSQIERDEFLQRGSGPKGTRIALLPYQNRIRVLIAGTHVERVNLAQPALSALTPATALAGGTVDLALTGSNLDKVSRLRVRKGPGAAAAEAEIKVGDNVRQATAKLVLTGLPEDTYNVYLVTPNGGEIPTSAKFTVEEALAQLSEASPASVVKGEPPTEITFKVNRPDLVEKILAVQNGTPDTNVTTEISSRDAAGVIKAAVQAKAGAKDGEHVWHLQSKGKQVASTARFSVTAPEPSPVLLRVSVASVKSGSPATAVVLEGERLDKVTSFELFQNGENDAGIVLAIGSKTATRVELTVEAKVAALAGIHRWALGGVESRQILEVLR